MMQLKIKLLQHTILTSALLCLGATGTSYAEDLAIQSFDGMGRLTFNELSTATTYRVDWATSPTGEWHTAWPGAINIAAFGFGQRVATVGVDNATYYYRVMASVTNSTPPGPGSDYMVVDISSGPASANYPVSYLPAVPSGGWTDQYKSTKMVFRRIPAGSFIMGSSSNELGRGNDETTHRVTLSSEFYIGVFPVTQKQWERVMGNWPSYFNNPSYRDARPVEMISYWDIRGSSVGTNWPATSSVDATSFMGRLRTRTGQGFDLPTESQWEYAGRAGSTTALNSGYDLTSVSADEHMNVLGRCYYNGGSNETQGVDTSLGTAKVGSYQPNAWGLYDVHGNVSQWCLDWYGIYPGTVNDPNGPLHGGSRVLRGGDFYFGASICRVARRGAYGANRGVVDTGFRVALPSVP